MVANPPQHTSQDIYSTHNKQTNVHCNPRQWQVQSLDREKDLLDAQVQGRGQSSWLGVLKCRSVPGFVSKIRLLFFVTQTEYNLTVAVRRSYGNRDSPSQCRLQSWRQRLHQTSRAAILVIESRSMPHLNESSRRLELENDAVGARASRRNLLWIQFPYVGLPYYTAR
jgi:hypothetical protein